METIYTDALRVDVITNLPTEICPHVCEAIAAQVPQVEDTNGADGCITFLWEDGNEYNPNRLESLKARLQDVLDFWYDGDDLVLTCPECEKFGSLDDWNEASATQLTEEDFELHDDEDMVCPNCGMKMLLTDIIYDNTKKTKEETEDVNENQNIPI